MKRRFQTLEEMELESPCDSIEVYGACQSDFMSLSMRCQDRQEVYIPLTSDDFTSASKTGKPISTKVGEQANTNTLKPPAFSMALESNDSLLSMRQTKSQGEAMEENQATSSVFASLALEARDLWMTTMIQNADTGSITSSFPRSGIASAAPVPTPAALRAFPGAQAPGTDFHAPRKPSVASTEPATAASAATADADAELSILLLLLALAEPQRPRPPGGVQLEELSLGSGWPGRAVRA
jgi:hypothetical protein